jgi:hypothetical protein
MSVSGDDFVLVSTDPNEVGTYAVTLTQSLLDFPMVPSLTTSFNAIIACRVTSTIVTLAPNPSTRFVIGKDNAITMPFGFVETPLCGLVFTI